MWRRSQLACLCLLASVACNDGDTGIDNGFDTELDDALCESRCDAISDCENLRATSNCVEQCQAVRLNAEEFSDRCLRVADSSIACQSNLSCVDLERRAFGATPLEEVCWQDDFLAESCTIPLSAPIAMGELDEGLLEACGAVCTASLDCGAEADRAECVEGCVMNFGALINSFVCRESVVLVVNCIASLSCDLLPDASVACDPEIQQAGEDC
ncbi:MAG: hypothetical protein WBG86_17615 [Polyangiales bacterium]